MAVKEKARFTRWYSVTCALPISRPISRRFLVGDEQWARWPRARSAGGWNSRGGTLGQDRGQEPRGPVKLRYSDGLRLDWHQSSGNWKYHGAREESDSMRQVVIESPIINLSYEEPTRHFRFTDEEENSW